MVIKGSEKAGPSKKAKTYHFHTEWEVDFFFIMSFLKCSICQSTIAIPIPKEGKCEAAFTDCSWKIPHRLPAEKPAKKKEKGGGTKIPVVRTAVIFHSTNVKSKSKSRHRSIVPGESRYC